MTQTKIAKVSLKDIVFGMMIQKRMKMQKQLFLPAFAALECLIVIISEINTVFLPKMMQLLLGGGGGEAVHFTHSNAAGETSCPWVKS